MEMLLNLKFSRATIPPMEQESKKQLYEMGYLAIPSFTEGEAQDFHQKIKNEVQSFGALIEDEGRIEKIRLSYPIKKLGEAYLGNLKFVLNPEKTNGLDSKIKEKTQILRILRTKTVRPQQKQINTKPFSMAPTFISPSQKEIKKEEPAANIEEIDKRLEEILGK